MQVRALNTASIADSLLAPIHGRIVSRQKRAASLEIVETGPQGGHRS
jgi:hypothetical protein